jgi:predicted Zn finger-like uncharacterized protein
MIIQCISCSRKFVVKDKDISKKGRMVQCGYCSATWHQMPSAAPTSKVKKTVSAVKPSMESSEGLSVDKIKASDGKTYKFLGSQWAELLPSGKTGLFARKKIGKELDELTGRKEKSAIKKKPKKTREVDPSSEKLPDVYKPKEGLGFFGYILVLIIIALSLAGILKTFEKELMVYFPEIENVFIFLNEQTKYILESIRNIIVIVQDIISAY